MTPISSVAIADRNTFGSGSRFGLPPKSNGADTYAPAAVFLRRSNRYCTRKTCCWKVDLGLHVKRKSKGLYLALSPPALIAAEIDDREAGALLWVDGTNDPVKTSPPRSCQTYPTSVHRQLQILRISNRPVRVSCCTAPREGQNLGCTSRGFIPCRGGVPGFCPCK